MFSFLPWKFSYVVNEYSISIVDIRTLGPLGPKNLKYILWFPEKIFSRLERNLELVLEMDRMNEWIIHRKNACRKDYTDLEKRKLWKRNSQNNPIWFQHRRESWTGFHVSVIQSYWSKKHFWNPCHACCLTWSFSWGYQQSDFEFLSHSSLFPKFFYQIGISYFKGKDIKNLE